MHTDPEETMDNNYNVDDILSEIKSRKSRERSAGTAAGGARPSGGAAQSGEAAVPPEVPALAESPLPDVGDTLFFTPPAPVQDPVKPSDRMAATTSFEAMRPAAGKPAPQTPGLSADKDGFEFVMPAVERIRSNPLNFEGHVRPITEKARIRKGRTEKAAAPPPPTTEEEPGGFHFSVPEEAAPPPPPPSAPSAVDFSAFRPPAEVLNAPSVQPDSPASRQELGRSRELNLEDIQKMNFGGMADNFGQADYGDYEDDFVDMDESPMTVPADLSEYNSVSDRNAVAKDIAKVKLWLVFRCLLTLGLTVGLFYLTLAGREPLPLPPFLFPERYLSTYLFTITGLSVLVALVNSSAVGGGLISLFKMRANSDTLVSLALLASIVQSVAAALRPETVNPENLGIYACVAALSMLFNALGKTTMINRIQSNFRIIASDKKKRAVLPVQSPEFIREFTRDPTLRRPTVAYSRETGFVTDFLALSYSDKYDVGINRGIAPVCLIGAIAISVAAYFLTGDSSGALAALAAILCLSATLSSTFIENIPLGKLAKRLTPKGGMVSGNKAVETFCDTQAVVLRDSDLFPRGHIQLHGIKGYAQGRIDEAILDAASVICSMDCALSPVFLQMIGGNRGLLKKVDNIAYESGMGISAWVNSRRVLIGNRALMEGHGILLPPGGYEQKYAQQGGEPIYLSNSGELSAQFVVSYQIDENLAVVLDQLAARQKSLIIYTRDPNITSHKIWELYGYPEELIHIMPDGFHQAYEEMAASKPTATGEVAYTGGAPVMVESILACINARASILAATIIQMVQIGLGYGLITFSALFGAMGTLNIIQLSAYQLFWFAAIFIVQKVRGA